MKLLHVLKTLFIIIAIIGASGYGVAYSLSGVFGVVMWKVFSISIGVIVWYEVMDVILPSMAGKLMRKFQDAGEIDKL